MGDERPPLFTTFTITYKVAVYAPAEWADTLTLLYFTSTNTQYVLCGRIYLLQVGHGFES